MKRSKHRRTIQFAAILAIFSASLMLCPFTSTMAFAHNVTVFAWVEGTRIVTESKFGGGRKAKGAVIEVFDDQNIKLLEGKTDGRGLFSFPIPKRSRLKVVLTAGAGHQSSWTVPAEDIIDAMERGPEPVTEKRPHPEAEGGNGDIGSLARPAAEKPSDTIRTEDISRAVETAVDKKLHPVIAKLDRLQAEHERARWKDVLGAIGYILGLVGLGAYIRYRKTSN